jgi:hypothetical protein
MSSMGEFKCAFVCMVSDADRLTSRERIDKAREALAKVDDSEYFQADSHEQAAEVYGEQEMDFSELGAYGDDEYLVAVKEKGKSPRLVTLYVSMNPEIGGFPYRRRDRHG